MNSVTCFVGQKIKKQFKTHKNAGKIINSAHGPQVIVIVKVISNNSGLWTTKKCGKTGAYESLLPPPVFQSIFLFTNSVHSGFLED